MVIQHNIAALNAHRNLGVSNGAALKSMEKLSSGYRINRAGDDAAGLAISEKMRGQIRGLGMAQRNIQDGVSLVQTAEGALQEVHSLLQRMRELGVQSSNGTYATDDRQLLDLEYQALQQEMTRISESTQFNGMYLFQGAVAEYDRVRNDGLATSANNQGWNFIFNSGPTNPSFSGNQTQVPGHVKFEVTVTEAGKIESVTLLDPGNAYDAYVYQDQYGRFVLRLDDIVPGNYWEVTFSLSRRNSDTFAGGVFVLNHSTSAAWQYLSEELYEWQYKGESGGEFIFQIGANASPAEQVRMASKPVTAAALGVDGTSLVSRQDANDALVLLDRAIQWISGYRAELGALQNRLGHALNAQQVAAENLTAAESTIRDADMAKELMEFTSRSIVMQSAQAMLAQAWAFPRSVLDLF